MVRRVRGARRVVDHEGPVRLDVVQHPDAPDRLFGHGGDATASGAICPWNGCGGFGIYLPSMVVVAPGEPGVLLVPWAPARPPTSAAKHVSNAMQTNRGPFVDVTVPSLLAL